MTEPLRLPANAGPSVSPLAGEQARFDQRAAEERTSRAYLPAVLHRGDANIPPLLRTASGAMYAVGGHRGSSGFTLIRVDKKPKSKKERREIRRRAKEQAARHRERAERAAASEAVAEAQP